MAKNRKTPDMNLPVWFDGQNINEALFCEEFLQERRIIFANGAFFTPNGRVTDDLPLRGEIYDKLKFCAVNNIPRKITNILEVLKLEAQVPDFPPEQDRIHLSNGTLLLDGTFTEGRPAIVRSRLPVAYNPNAPAPEIWQNFLDGLLHAEDIPTLQEFIGYCLIPSNKGQRMMVIKGNGGEGKSQIGAVLSSIFGTNMKDGSIGKISENRFARADLEHILLYYSADLNANMNVAQESAQGITMDTLPTLEADYAAAYASMGITNYDMAGPVEFSGRTYYTGTYDAVYPTMQYYYIVNNVFYTITLTNVSDADAAMILGSFTVNQ